MLIVCVFLAALLIIVGNLAGLIGAFWLLQRYIDHKQAAIQQQAEELIQSWVSQPSAGEPSQLAKLLDAGGAIVGSAVARSIMASLSAESSHTAKLANTTSDLITSQQNPILGLLTGGKRGKGAAMLRLAELLGPMLGGKGSSGGNGDGEKPTQRSFTM